MHNIMQENRNYPTPTNIQTRVLKEEKGEDYHSEWQGNTVGLIGLVASFVLISRLRDSNKERRSYGERRRR